MERHARETLTNPIQRVILRSLGDEGSAFLVIPGNSRFFAALRMTRVVKP
jgi:hypothetical protein